MTIIEIKFKFMKLTLWILSSIMVELGIKKNKKCDRLFEEVILEIEDKLKEVE